MGLHLPSTSECIGDPDPLQLALMVVFAYQLVQKLYLHKVTLLQLQLRGWWCVWRCLSVDQYQAMHMVASVVNTKQYMWYGSVFCVCAWC